jgi:hypothetical protein
MLKQKFMAKKEIKKEETKNEKKDDIPNIDLMIYENKYTTTSNQNEIYEKGDPRKEERENIMKKPIRNVKKKGKRPVFKSQ